MLVSGDHGFQTGVGEDMGIHQGIVSRTFATLVEALVAKADTWIQFPVDPADFQAAKDDWQNKFAFPCAIGALDCTHVQILKPGLHVDEYIFFVKDLQPLMFRQLVMLLKDSQVFRQIGQDLYMIAEFGRIQTWEL